MAKLFFVVVTLYFGGALATSLTTRADDPIVAEITRLEDQLFYQENDGDASAAAAARVPANQTLERLIRLESLAAQRVDHGYDQLLRDVRELISFSEITDEKCRADESIGVMLNFNAYYDISYTIRDYWAEQATRQLERCLTRLNEALARRDDLSPFVSLIETVKNEDDKISSYSLRDGYIKGTLVFLESGEGGDMPKSEAKFDSLWGELIEKPCADAMQTIEPWIEIFHVHKSVYLNGIRMETNEDTETAKLMSWGAEYCQKIVALKRDILELYMPKGIEAILNHALDGNFQGVKDALYEAANGGGDE